MAVDIQCAGCRRRFRVADKFAGKRVKCPNCSVPIRVPALSKTETPARPPGPAPPVGEATRRREEQESPPAETGETSTQSTDADDVDTSGAVAEPDRRTPLADVWYVQTDDGEQYGPVDRRELDAWFHDGRIDASCQILRAGWDQWQWADDVYPELLEDDGSGIHRPLPHAADARDHGAVLAGRPISAADETAEALPDAAGGGLDGAEKRAELRAPLRDALPWITAIGGIGLVVGAVALSLAIVRLVTAIGAGATSMVVISAASVASALLVLWTGYVLMVHAARIRRFIGGEGLIPLESVLRSQSRVWRTAGLAAIGMAALWIVATLAGWLLGGGPST